MTKTKNLVNQHRNKYIKMEEIQKIKKGDRVRVIDNISGYMLSFGETGTVTIYNNDVSFTVCGDDYGSDTGCWMESHEVELIDDDCCYEGACVRDDEITQDILSDKENEFLYTGGETVVVTDFCEQYTTYNELADKMGLPNFQYNVDLKNGDIGTVVGYLPHGDFQNYDQIVGIDIDGKQFLISIKGVKKVQDNDDLKEHHKFVCQYYDNREVVLFDEIPDEDQFKILEVVTYYK